MKNNESSGPVQVSFFSPQAVMPHPDNSPHPVQKFLGHDANLCGNSNIWPETIRIRDRKTRALLVGKSAKVYRKMPHICGKKPDWPGKINNVCNKKMPTGVIKEQSAWLFDKNSFR
ncbi:MAG: hypothetical protein RQ826_06350, partial [Xanthomonadales bacterium]|nr:hypothetical protein [Xanthomonadales bacterium]